MEAGSQGKRATVNECASLGSSVEQKRCGNVVTVVALKGGKPLPIDIGARGWVDRDVHRGEVIDNERGGAGFDIDRGACLARWGCQGNRDDVAWSEPAGREPNRVGNAIGGWDLKRRGVAVRSRDERPSHCHRRAKQTDKS